MSEKTYVFGEGTGTNGIISALAPMLQNKGIDPGVLAMMNNNGFGGNGAWIWIFFLAILGIPVMTMEFAIGRGSRKSPTKMYNELEPKGTKWHIHGKVSLLSNYTPIYTHHPNADNN